MADENVSGNPNETTAASGKTVDDGTPSGVKVDVNDKVTLTRRAGWWGILTIYALLFISMGYMSFFSRDVNPALKQVMQNTSTQFSNDAETKALVLNMIQQEANEHNKKESLALQSFNVVLGSLLGFLSASAVSKVSGGDNT
jgi:hypothetical protein